MLFRFLLIFFILYLIINFIKSFLRPAKTNSQSKNFNSGSRSNRREGEVTITKPNTNKKVSDDEGEYIDYEDA